jgi:hypothetical protein
MEGVSNHEGASDARERATESANEEHSRSTIVLE